MTPIDRILSFFAPKQTCRDTDVVSERKSTRAQPTIVKDNDDHTVPLNEEDKKILYKALKEFIDSPEMQKRDAEYKKFVAESKALDARQQELSRMKAENDRLLKEAAIKTAQLQQEKIGLLVENFLCIFHFQNPSAIDEVNLLFSTYVGQSISLDRNEATKEAYTKLSSMTGVVKYITDHPNIKVCDFLYFDEVHDIKTLADCLAQPSCPVRGVRLIDSTSTEDKNILSKAAEARASNPKRRLQVIYAPKQA